MFTKKLTLFLLFILFHLQFSTALSQIIVIIERPPLNQITVQDLWKLTLNNPTKETFTAYFIGTVEEPSKGKIYEGTSSEFQLKPGINRIRVSDLKIRSDFYIKEYENIIMRTGIAPEGNYQICVNVLNTKDKVQIGKGCIVHTIIAQRHIDLISPINNEVINSGTQIIFRSTPILQPDTTPPTDIPRAVPYTPKPKKGVTYIIKIVELYPNQSPEDAMRKNFTFYENESETPILIYPANAKKFEPNKQYAWQAKAFYDGKEIAFSDVWTFTIAPHSKYISKIQLISPENNLIVNVSDPEGDWIDFKWNLPETDLRNNLQFKLKIVEVNKNQPFQEAIKVNPVWFEKDGIKDSEYKYFLRNKAFDKNKTYSWQVHAVLESGELIPSEIFSFTCSLESTTETSCGWPTLINEFLVKSDVTNVILNSWPGSASTSVFVIPCVNADSVWGWATGCYNPYYSPIWPPLTRTCCWFSLYDRGACWITSPEFDWKRIPVNIRRIIKNYFSLSENVTNVRLYVACDDSVDIYINPSSASLNNDNPGYIGSHNSYSTLGIISLPDLHMGTHNLILDLRNIHPAKMAIIYGMDYTPAILPPPTAPPIIGFPSLPLRYCYNEEAREIEIRASLNGRINRHCTELIISSSDGIRERMTFTPMSDPILNIEHSGLGEDDLSYSAYVRVNALWLFERLAGSEIQCSNFTATLRAGNGDCSEFSEQSWNFTIDIDNRPPEVSFILPPLTIPTTIPDYRLIIPLTEPRKYEKIEEPGGYCLNLPLPEQFQIDISWASGLDARDIVIVAKFQRKLPVPIEEDPNIFTFPEGDIIIEIDRSVLSFHIENTSGGYQLWMNSSIITAYLLERGITLQEDDLLTFSIVFSDNPCICERSNFQASYRFKICSF